MVETRRGARSDPPEGDRPSKRTTRKGAASTVRKRKRDPEKTNQAQSLNPKKGRKLRTSGASPNTNEPEVQSASVQGRASETGRHLSTAPDRTGNRETEYRHSTAADPIRSDQSGQRPYKTRDARAHEAEPSLLITNSEARADGNTQQKHSIELDRLTADEISRPSIRKIADQELEREGSGIDDGTGEVEELPLEEEETLEDKEIEAEKGDGESVGLVLDEIIYYDMVGTKRVFSTGLVSFIVPFPECTAPQSLLHFAALYIIRNEARRVFPRQVQLSWLTDFCLSHWIQKETDPANEAEQQAEAILFSEHEPDPLRVLLKKRFLLFPFLADNCYSLVVIEGLQHLVEVLTTLLRLEETLPRSTAAKIQKSTLLQRVKRFDTFISIQSINSCSIFHLDWNERKHRKYRAGFRKWVVELCFFLIPNLIDSCSRQVLEEFVEHRVKLNVPKIPNPPQYDHESTWKVLEYLLLMLHEPKIHPETGKMLASDRDDLLSDSLDASRYGSILHLQGIASRAVTNMQFAKEDPRINPYPGLWGGVATSLNRDVTEPLIISSRTILPCCLPVVLEFGLKALDDYIDLHKQEFHDSDAEELTINDDNTNPILFLSASRQWACTKLLKSFEDHVWIERHGMKPRDRPMRFWKSVFDHVMSLPPYRDSANIFSAMRRFPDSVSVSLGLEYLHAKEHRLFFYQATSPNLRHGERPWKLFDHASKNLNKSNQWFERRAWGRMHEAGVIMFALTEYIFRCAKNHEAKTEAELANLLKKIKLEKEEFVSSVVTCPVHLSDIVHHIRKRKENVDQYKKKVSTRLEDAAEATKLSFSCASDAFKKSLIPFGSAYAVKRGVQGQNVALCKLKQIPGNMLDMLWQNVTSLLKETLSIRQKKGEFIFKASEYILDYEVEAQLIRLFRVMNTVFVESAETLMRELFLTSRERLELDIASFMLQHGAGEGRRLQKLKAIPNESLWNFVESRYSGGYLSSGIMAAASAWDEEDIFPRKTADNITAAGKVSEVSTLQALSARGIPSRSLTSSEWVSSSLTSLFDIRLALQVEPVACINIDTANFAWSLVAALSSILQTIPGHVQSSYCFTRTRTSCPPKPDAVSSCLNIMSEIAENVGRTWVMGYGIDSLQTQSVFIRFDALTSVVFAIVGSSEYGCRPSIDASLCEFHDQRRARNRNAFKDAFMGYPADVLMENGNYIPTKWRGVLLNASITNLPYPEQRVETEVVRSSYHSTDRRPPRKITSVDFLHLASFNLPAPQVHKTVLRYKLETPEFQAKIFSDRNGEINFQVGDVFWLSMISVGNADRSGFVGSQGYSGSHLGVMMEPASTTVHRQHGRCEDPIYYEKEQRAAILFLPQEDNPREREGFEKILDRMVSRNLCDEPRKRGEQGIRMIPTDINIESELSTFHVTFRLRHYLPRAVNLASVHPKLLQMHTQYVLATLHRRSSSSDRKKGIVPTESAAETQERMRKEISDAIEAMFPRLKPEQLQAISIPLLWVSLMQSGFFDTAGNPQHNVRDLFSDQFNERDMKYIGTNLFFVRGPPGTGKSFVITSLIIAALFGHTSEEVVKKVLPKSVKRIMVVTHTNAAVDDILSKVVKARQFNVGELVRIGVRGKSARTLRYTSREVFRRRVDKERSERDDRNGRSKFPSITESQVIDDALVVFSTFGSLQRTEFAKALKGFNMVIVEEAGKLHEGDLILGLAQLTGMKNSPEPGFPLTIVSVGDEMQLPPHSKIDPNLSVPSLCPAPLFDRYVSKCEMVSAQFDFNYPITLLTQHRAHRAIANIHSHFAYKGVIQTGARESWERWNADKMDERIEESLFKFRTVSVVSYRGAVNSDVRGAVPFGGNTNKLEYEIIFSICKDWCYRSRKFDNRITILSPYKAQVEKMKGWFEKESQRQEYRGLGTIEVYTVDSSQGLENDIVLLSLVRTHQSQKQAFLDNPYRINVMISRARERLIIVGARNEVCSISANWNRLYTIVDALAREERAQREENPQHDENDSGKFHYGYYDILSGSAVHGPKDVPQS